MLGSRVAKRSSEFRVQVFNSKKRLLFDAAPVCLRRRDGTGLGAFGMEGLPLSVPRVGAAAGRGGPVSLCVRGHVGQHLSHLGRAHPPLLPNRQPLCAAFTRLRSRPRGRVAPRDKDLSPLLPWLQFKHIQCHCKFYGTIFYWRIWSECSCCTTHKY